MTFERLAGLGIAIGAMCGAAHAQVSSNPTNRPFVQLMPKTSAEEQDMHLARGRTNLGQAGVQVRPGSPPSPIDRLRNMLSENVLMLDDDYRARTIPHGKIVAVEVVARSANGTVLGPHSMTSSLAPSFSTAELASARPARVERTGAITGRGTLLSQGEPQQVPATDGDQRFLGGVLASVKGDSSLVLNLAVILDGQPLRIVGVEASSGVTIEVETPVGYVLGITPVLRDMTDPEQSIHDAKADTPEYRRHADALLTTWIDPHWPGPAYVGRPVLPLAKFAGTQVRCADWITAFSNDPKVQVSDSVLSGEAVSLTINQNGELNVLVPSIPSVFDLAVFPRGLVSEQLDIRERRLNGVYRLGRSAALSDVTELFGANGATPFLNWDRIRKDEDDVVYRTKFFLRCERLQDAKSSQADH